MLNNTKIKNDISVEILMNVRSLLCLNRSIASRLADLFTSFGLTYGFTFKSKISASNRAAQINLA